MTRKIVKSRFQKRLSFEVSLWFGIDFFAWVRLLVRNRLAISWSKLPQVVLITLVAGVNTCLRGLQTIGYRAALCKVLVPDDPIFIIGHWRTGTTMLHELLSLDPSNRCPSTYECLSPNHFLLSESFVRRWAWWILPRTRPFDNMRMSFDRPQEDEAALCLRGQPSPFLTAAFPKRPLQNSRYVDLEGISPRQLSAWKSKLMGFLRLLLYRRAGRLVLKSPQHTFRLKVLNEMFPRARFVYLVRNPYEVYPSTVHFWTKVYTQYGLQRYDEERLGEQVLSTFARMHTSVETRRAEIDSERFFELRYEDLTANPLEQMKLLYDFFELNDFDTVRPAIEKYSERSQRYQTNQYDLDENCRNAITQRWSAYFQKHGYQTHDVAFRATPEI